MIQPVITGYSTNVEPGSQVIVTGTGFGRVANAFLVDIHGNITPTSSHVDSGTSVHVDIPLTTATGAYIVILSTLDIGINSTNSGGTFSVTNTPTPTPPAVTSTIAAVREIARGYYGDAAGSPFQSAVNGDGKISRYTLSDTVVDSSTMTVFISPNDGTDNVPLVLGTDFYVDETNGVITTTNPVPEGQTLVALGTSYSFFTDAQLDKLISTAVNRHTHGVTIVTPYYDANNFHIFPSVAQTVEMLSAVDVELVGLLAAINALWYMLADASYDIDVLTADGTSLPRSQRRQAIQEMIVSLQARYDQFARLTNTGLARAEMFTLRRVSRTTNRLVPVYIAREYDDHSLPMRVFPPIDQDLSGTGTEAPQPFYSDGYGF